MKNMNEHLGFCSVAVGAFALALGLAACGDGESSNGPANDDDSSSSSVILSSSSSVILSDSEGSSSSKANWSYLNPDIDYGEFTDERDGQVYKTVTIGTQIWMAENLNYNTNDSYCYGNNASNCSKYGRLYTWSAAMNACPSGWHLPSDTEWNTLWTAVGRTSTAGTKLKSTSGWYSGNGTDSFGFAVLPAGYRNNDGNFRNEGDFADFWSSTENSSDGAYDWYFRYDDDNMYNYWSNKNYAHSVRCLRGSSPTSSSSVSYGTLTDLRDNQTYKTVTIGTQTWMAENLNYDPGDVSSMGYYAWSGCYGNKADSCSKYGRLYTWEVAMNDASCAYTCGVSLNPTIPVQGVCPSGWHLPSHREFEELINFIDPSFGYNHTSAASSSTAGKYLKAKSGWNSSGNGTDIFGFSALPSGDRYGYGDFDDAGIYADFWSSGEGSSNYAFVLPLSYDSEGACLGWGLKNAAKSVRCLKD